MAVRRILLAVFLLCISGQAASACPEAHVASAAVPAALEITVSTSEDFVAAGSDQRCECPAIAQDPQAVVSESSKSLTASYVEGAGAFLILSNPASVEPAVYTRASSFIARRPGQPPYLLASRLRQ